MASALGTTNERVSNERLADLIQMERRTASRYQLGTYSREYYDSRLFAFTELQQRRASVVTPDSVTDLFLAAWAEADKAMRKFPQPNYVISKVAEEAGEVVKAAIHCAEGRDTPEHVVAEIKQAMAMLIRLFVEGDQVHGLPPPTAAGRAALEANNG